MNFLWSFAYGHPEWLFKGKNYYYELSTCRATLLTYIFFCISQKHCTLGRGRSKTQSVRTSSQIAHEMVREILFQTWFSGLQPSDQGLRVYVHSCVHECADIYTSAHITAGGQSTASGISPQKLSTAFLDKVWYGLELGSEARLTGQQCLGTRLFLLLGEVASVSCLLGSFSWTLGNEVRSLCLNGRTNLREPVPCNGMGLKGFHDRQKSLL